MKKIIIILLMLAGLALNLTDNGLEIVSRNTVSAQTWDGDFNNNAYWGGIDVNEEQLGNNDNSTHSTVEPLTPPPIEGFDTTGPDIPDIDIPDNDSGQADNSGSGYSDADDDGGYDDGMGENGDNGDNGYGDDTTDNQNDNEYDNGQNGEQDEVYDCMGILNGKAYVNQCGECIDGNKGQIYTDDEKAKSLLNELKKGCFIQTLLSILDANSGVTIVANPEQKAPGNYNPCKNRIGINPNTADLTALGAEILHSVQQQFYGNKMTDMSKDYENDHIGGSNIEFEEKAFDIIAADLEDRGYSVFSGTDKLQSFWYYFYDKYKNEGFPLSFSVEEKAAWFNALEEFQSYHSNVNNSYYYGKPIDYNFLPTLILTLLNQSKCK